MPYLQTGDWTDYITKGLDYGQKAVSTGQQVVNVGKQAKSVVEEGYGIFKGSGTAPPVAPTPVVRDQRIVLTAPSAMAPRGGGSLLGNLLSPRTIVLAGAAYLGYRLWKRRK